MLKKKKWLIDKPLAATMEEWRNWHKESRQRYPVRYFLQETFPTFIRRHIVHPINKFYWAIKHRVHPQHRYHILKTGLKPGYHEIDTRMLYSCFNLFKDHYEYELERGYADLISEETEENEQPRQLWAEMTDIYTWWCWYSNEEEREKVYKEYPKLPEGEDSTYYLFNEQEEESPAAQEWRQVASENSKIEEALLKQEDEMFIRLIKIRRSLWT